MTVDELFEAVERRQVSTMHPAVQLARYGVGIKRLTAEQARHATNHSNKYATKPCAYEGCENRTTGVHCQEHRTRSQRALADYNKARRERASSLGV